MRRSVTMRAALRTLAFLAFWPIATTAQSTSGNIAGVIYDPSGATVANANIKAKNQATGVQSSTISTSAGNTA